MVVHALTSTATRAFRHTATSGPSRRSMGSAVKKDWEGIDKIVRDKFPEDYQLAGAILGGYTVLISLAVLRSKFSSSPESLSRRQQAATSGTSFAVSSYCSIACSGTYQHQT